MREVKFNLVDEDTGEYVRFDEWLEANEEPSDEGFEALSRFLSFYYGFKALQYTGYQDDSSKEIFEHDIVDVNFTEEYSNECAVFEERSKNTYKVVFNSGGWFLVQKNGTWIYLHDIIDIAEIKVVGNSHENKELLDAK